MNGRGAARAVLAGLLLAGAGPALALTTNTGENASQFLQLGAGARALGMGEAYGPVAEGAEAIYWNPGGLASLPRPDFIYARSEFMRFFHHDFAAYAHPVKMLRGTLAGSFTRFSQESLRAVDNANQTVGEFSPHAEVFALGYAHDFGSRDPEARDRDYFRETWALPQTYRPLDHEPEPWAGRVCAGLALKIVSETIYTRNSVAVAADGGVLYRPLDEQSLRLSFAFRNAGSRQRFLQESADLPVEVDIGAAWDARWREKRLLPAVEVSLPYYGNPHGKAGVEYSLPAGPDVRVAFRAGYKSLTATDLSPLSGITGGIGARYKKFSLDTGFQPLAGLGELYRMSASFRW